MLGEGQTKVVTDLITLYPRIYDVTDTEMAREMKMLSFFEKYHSAAPSQQPISKPSGDLRIWVSIGQPGSGETVQIAVS